MPRGRVAADVWKSEYVEYQTDCGPRWVHKGARRDWAKKMPAETEIAAAARFFRSRWHWTVPVELRDRNGRLLARHTQTNWSKIWRRLACRVFAHRVQRLRYLMLWCPGVVKHLMVVQKNVRDFVELRKCWASELEKSKRLMIQKCYETPEFGALLTRVQMEDILNGLPGVVRGLGGMSWRQGVPAELVVVSPHEFETALRVHIQDGRELFQSEYKKILHEKIAVKRNEIELKRFVREAVSEVRAEMDESWDLDMIVCGVQQYRVEVDQEEMPRLFGNIVYDLP